MDDRLNAAMVEKLNGVQREAESRRLVMRPGERRHIDFSAPGDTNRWTVVGARPYVPLDMEKALLLSHNAPLIEIGEGLKVARNHLYFRVAHGGVSLQAGEGPVIIEDGIKKAGLTEDKMLPSGERANIDVLTNPVVLHLGADRNGYSMRIFFKPGEKPELGILRVVMNLNGTEMPPDAQVNNNRISPADRAAIRAHLLN